jgi:hypothetical protein
MGKPQIENYRFGRIRIDGADYYRDVIIFPDHVQSDWWRVEGHSLALEDLETVLPRSPSTLIVGRGAYGRMAVPEETRRAIEAAGIEVLAEKTGEAVKTYNRMREKGNIIAALHLTC